MNAEILMTCEARTEEVALKSQERYRQLLEAVTDYVYSVKVDGRRAVDTRHGPGCEAVTGYTPAEFDAEPMLWLRMVFAEDQLKVLSQVERIFDGGAPPALEHRIQHKNGSIRWIRNTTVPLYRNGGQLLGYDGVVSDITERKRAEQALQESQARLELVIRGSNDGIWDWNVLTNEVYFSERWKSMLGYAEHELAGTFQVWVDLLPPEDRERARGHLEDYLSGRIPSYELEHRLRHKDGSYRWVLARGVALRDGQRNPVRMAGSHVDLTERKQAEEELRQAYSELARSEAQLKRTVQELRSSHGELKTAQLQLIQSAKMESVGTLAAGVAHEVKNPLQTILMGLDYLAHNLPGSNLALQSVLDDMREAVARADAIARELLHFSAASDFSLKPEDLNDVLKRCLWLIRAETIASQITVDCRLTQPLPPVEMDRGKMEQVFINLFINALQAMSHGGVLTVTSRVECFGEGFHPRASGTAGFSPGEPVVLIAVQDTGPGIREADLPRIFDPFFTTKPVGVGTGLGLSVVKQIVQFHRGLIDINNAVGGGAQVTLAFRAKEDKSHAKP